MYKASGLFPTPHRAGAAASACSPSVQEVEARTAEVSFTSFILGYIVHLRPVGAISNSVNRLGEGGKEREGGKRRQERKEQKNYKTKQSECANKIGKKQKLTFFKKNGKRMI